MKENMIKKMTMITLCRVLTLGIVLILSGNVSAQTSGGLSYLMTTGVNNNTGWFGTLTNILINQNDAQTNVISFGGPTFPYAGQTYSGFVLSSNGWIALTNAPVGPSPIPSSIPANSLAAGSGIANTPIIAPLWDDLQSTVQYTLTATHLAVRWNGTRWQFSSASATLVIEARLTFANGVIDFNYLGAYTPTTPSASIGITGVCAGDYYSVKPSFTTGQIDSTIDNNHTTKPNNTLITWTPNTIFNNICSNAYDLGSITASCVSPQTFSNIMANNSGATPPMCTADNRDVWFRFTKPAGMTDIRVSTDYTPACSPLAGTTVQVYSGTCATLNSLGCSTTNLGASNSKGVVEVNGRPQCTPEVLYVRVTGDGDLNGKFQICANDKGTISIGPGTGATCATSTVICGLPYTHTGFNTAGYVNDYDSAATPCQTAYTNGQDYVFSYTPPANQCVRISLTNTGANSFPFVGVYNGCPNVGGTQCLATASAVSNGATINSISLVGGTTYYILVDNNSAGGSMPFDFSMTQLAGIIPYDDCPMASNLGTIGINVNCTWQTNLTTECARPTNAPFPPLPSCDPTFVNGATGDVWFRFTAGFTGSVLVNTRPGSVNPITDAAMAVYTGACGAMTLFACDDNTAPLLMPSATLNVTNGVTYYIRIWSVGQTNTGTFDLCISSACAPTNDLPCNAQPLTMGSPTLGNNTCAGNASEPPPGTCWGAGSVNTVWFTAVVPASGRLNIKASVLTLTDTQIAAYLFASGCASASTTYTQLGCNDNSTPGCPCSGGDLGSELRLTGLTPGATVYISVDGKNDQTGSFFITAVDGNNTYPPIYGQDCAGAINVCSNAALTVNTPYLGTGNYCDQTGNPGCFSCGERSGTWFTFTVNPPSFQFKLTPNTSSPLANFDFALWDVTGQADPCNYIRTTVSVVCNNSGATGAGVTGMFTPSGGAVSPPTTFGSPRTYVLAFRNWNHTPVGFTIDWMGSNIVQPSNAILTWQGNADTTFSNCANYTCCSTIDCAKDILVVTGGSVINQPTVSVNTNVHNLTIFAGATLRIKSGVTLSLCGNLNVFGTLIAEPGSTIRFTGTENQTINGGVTGTNSLANLLIDKTAGNVQANTNVDVRENFTTLNNTSIFNINGRILRVGGNFTNAAGGTTFTGIGGSTVEFNGTGVQNFTNNSGVITLNRVFMNKTGTTPLNLVGNWSKMDIDSFLTLTGGRIVTRSLANLEVNVKYSNAGAIIGGNNNSYVDGKLRRKIWNGAIVTGIAWDFPVGEGAPGSGYQLATVTFTSNTVMPDLLAYFTTWSAWPALGPTASECIVATYDILPFFNNGFWTFVRQSPSFGGIHSIALRNNNFTNSAGSNGWTVAVSDTLSNPALTASWNLIGSCVIASTPTNTQRMNINNPSNIAHSFNLRYATVQSDVPLPIELLSFDAEPEGNGVLCKWVTASEINNDYFEIERSSNGEDFKTIGKVDGFGAGTSTTTREYKFLDSDMCTGKQYYRLRQVDIDGQFSYSDVIVINCKRTRDDIRLYPNPATSSISLTFFEQSGSLSIQFVDFTGRVVKEELVILNEGYNTVSMDISGLSKGIYYVKLNRHDQHSDESKQIRFVKN